MAENPKLSELVSIGQESAGLALFDILQVAQAQTDFPVVVIGRIDGDSYVIEAIADLTRSAVRPGAAFELGLRFDKDIAALRCPVAVPDATGDDHFAKRARRSNIGAFLGVPIIFSDGTLFGSLSGYSSDARPITKESTQLFKTLARAASRELERSEALSSVTLPGADPRVRLTGIAAAAADSWRDLEEGERESLAASVELLASVFAGAVGAVLGDEAAAADDEPTEQLENEWPANFDEIVARAPSLLPNLPGPRVRVECSTDALVDLESRVLERILANMLLNAWRSAPPNTRMSVTGTRHARHVELAVEDQSGLGSDESQPRRLHPAGGGRIGLPIVKSLVENAGGSVRQETTDEGRRYVVKLPVLRSVGDPEQIASVTPLKRPPTG